MKSNWADFIPSLKNIQTKGQGVLYSFKNELWFNKLNELLINKNNVVLKFQWKTKKMSGFYWNYLLEKWLSYKLRRFWMVFNFFHFV